MLQVLVSSTPVLPWASAAVVRHDRPADDAELEALTGRVARMLDDGHVVLALLPAGAPDELIMRLRAVRSALDTTRFVVHPTALPPLATAVLAEAVAEVASSGALRPETAVSGVAALERSLACFAWLGSVARLERPAPSVWQHLRSWLPASSFLALLGDEPRVRSLPRRATAELPLPPIDPPAQWCAIVSTDLSELGPLAPGLEELGSRGVQVLRFGGSPESTSWWGTDQVIEVTVLPRTVDRLADGLLGGREPVTCRWCGQLAAQLPCLLCGSDAPAAALVSEEPA